MNPIDTLRDYKAGVILVDFAPGLREVPEKEWDAALEAVQALHQAARALLVDLGYTYEGDEGCDCPSCALFAALARFEETT